MLRESRAAGTGSNGAGNPAAIVRELENNTDRNFLKDRP